MSAAFSTASLDGFAYLDYDKEVSNTSLHFQEVTRLTQIERMSDTGRETAGAAAEPQWVVDRAMLDIL